MSNKKAKTKSGSVTSPESLITNSQSRTPSPESLITNSQSPVPSPEIAISVKNICKSFRMYDSPAERLKELLHPFKKKYHKDFWALRDSVLR
jgi:hypothetical protein